MEELLESSSQLSMGSLYNFQNPPYLTHTAQEFSKGDNNYLKGCKWSPDGTCILTNSADSCLRLFNAPDLSSLPPTPEPWSSVLRSKEVDLVYDYCWYPLMSSLDQATSCFLTTAKTAPIHLWDAFTGALRASYIAKDNADQIVAAFSVMLDPSGALVYAGYDNVVRIFDISRPGEDCDLLQIGRKYDKQGGIISCIAFDPSGVDLVAFGSYNRSIGIYTPDGDLMTLMEGHKGGITHIKFSKDGLRLFSGARQDNSICCWDLRTGKILHEFSRQVDTNQRIYFDIDPHEEYLCSGQNDGQICLWTLKDLPDTSSPLEPNYKFSVHDDMVNGISFHPQWCVLVTGSGQKHVSTALKESLKDDLELHEKVAGEDSVKLCIVQPPIIHDLVTTESMSSAGNMNFEGSSIPTVTGSKDVALVKPEVKTAPPAKPMYDDDDNPDPYLEQLLDVLDEVENKGEPYLERMILEAGLEFSSQSEDEADDDAKKEQKKEKLKTDKRKKRKDTKVRVGILEPIDDDYKKLYGTYKDGAGAMSSDEDDSVTSSSSTTTTSLVNSLAEMIAKGEAPVIKDQPEELETYGTRLVPYGSFEGGSKDAGLAKNAKTDKIIREARDSPVSSVISEEESKKQLSQCVGERESSLFSSESYSEDFYDEGKSQHNLIRNEAPVMVLLSSSEDEDYLESPQHYYEYTQKESQCLAIVTNFRRQFTDAYPDRKPLFLTPVNEVGVPRFVCSTIRPTIFSYTELFHWDGIARFVSYQMEYILLNPPDLPPTVVMSPAFILRERQGNCFDYCFILASILIGVGYDAYIVNGYAMAAICTGDESHRLNPTMPQESEPEAIPAYEKEFDFSEMQSEVVHDLFQDTIHRQRTTRIKERNESVEGLEYLLQEERKRSKQPIQKNESDDEEEELDPYEKQRVHAWIVILSGKRDITEPFYIDPFTGQEVESIWNHRQYYVNMQQPMSGEALTWDVSDQQKWEPMFTEHAMANRVYPADEMTVDSDEHLSADGFNTFSKNVDSKSPLCKGPTWPFKGFEMPGPWSDPLTISKKRYLRFAKNGYRLHRFKKCDMEFFQVYERKDGLVNKVIAFSNKRKTHISYVKETYANRRDRLKYRKYLVKDGTLREYFSPGHTRGFRTHEVKIHSEKPPKFSELYKALNCFKIPPNIIRTFTYYSEYRNDGLRKLEQRSDEMFWYHEKRKDNLVFRKITYGTQIDRSYAVEALKCKGDQRPIATITEKFDRNPGVSDPDLDIYIREFDVVNSKLTLIFQPEDGLLTSTQRRFNLPNFNETLQSGTELPIGYLLMNDEAVNVIFRDQLQEEHRLPIDIWDEMVANYKQSLQAILRIRRAEDDFMDEVTQRIEEEQEPLLWHSAYDVERHPRAAEILKKTQETTILKQPLKAEDLDWNPNSFDWVAPYMAAYGDKTIASLDDALGIRQTILEDLKERLLYTANALQKAHEELFQTLQDINEKFRKAQVGGEISPKDFVIYENEKTGIQFKMHILERRQELLQFEGPVKLKKLNDWILKDPRFCDWFKGLQLDTREHMFDDELMTVKKHEQKWTSDQRKKVWKHDSEDGDITVAPLEEEEGGIGAAGDASGSDVALQI